MDKITSFIRHDYQIANANTVTNKLIDFLAESEPVVIRNNDKYVGVLTSVDIIKNPRSIAYECVSEKPIVNANDEVGHVLEIMIKHKVDVLSVCDNGSFAGLVYKDDLVAQLIKKDKKRSMSKTNKQNDGLEQDDVDRKILSVVAHDLRVPVSSIISFIDLLYKRHDSGDRSKDEEYLKVIKTSAENCLKLLEHLQLWSRSGSVRIMPEQIDLQQVVNNVADCLHIQIKEKQISLNISVAKEKVVADNFMIHAIIRNVMCNAVKFSYPGGIIDVYVAETQNNMVKLCIKDYGIGIKKSHFSELFKPGRSLSVGTNSEKGTGFGLSLCRDLLTLNNGAIEIESLEGAGTSVYISFPC